MSLIEVKNSQIIRNQVKYKLKTNIGSLTSLIVSQVIALLLTIGSSSGGGIGSSWGLEIEYEYYTIDFISFFIIIWAFMVGMILPRLINEEATFIATHKTNTIANLIYVLLLSCIAAATTIFAGYLQKVLLMINGTEVMDVGFSLFSDPSLFIGTIYVHILYYFLACSLGYLFGTCVKYSRILLIVIPAILFGLLVFSMNKGVPIFQHFIFFYYNEPSMIIFFIKILLTVIVFFGLSHLLNKRMEVGK